MSENDHLEEDKEDLIPSHATMTNALTTNFRTSNPELEVYTLHYVM